MKPRLWLKVARISAGLKQWELAEMVGVNQGTICALEIGKTSSPRSSTIWKIEDVLGVNWRENEEKSA